MKNSDNYSYRLRTAARCWLCALLLATGLAACSTESGGENLPNLAGTYDIRLAVGTKSPATKADDDDNAYENEFINTLFVVIAQDGKVLHSFEPYKDESQNGKQTTWTSSKIELKAGKYIAYAFANMESLPNNEWKTVLEGLEGGTIADLDDKVITMFDVNEYDPTKGTYLPMSRKYDFTVTESGTITIPLVRMVSRVEVTIDADAGLTLSDFTFSGFADKEYLFVRPEALNEAIDDNQNSQLKVPNEITNKDYIKSGVLPKSFYFYVSETKGKTQEHFTIKIKLGETEITPRHLDRQYLVRNRIWPIRLLIKSVQCKYDFEGGNQPIGGSEESTYVNAGNDYVCSIKGGGRFKLSLNGVARIGDESNSITISKWKITNWDTVNGKLDITAGTGEYTGSSCTIEGRLPSEGDEIKLEVTATAENAQTYDFIFSLKHEDLFKK